MLFSACCPCCLWPLIARWVFIISKQPPQDEENLSEQCWRWVNFLSSGTSEFFLLHVFLGQMIKHYRSQHCHNRQSVWQGQGKEELVPIAVCFISLALKVSSSQWWRQVLCQSFNQLAFALTSIDLWDLFISSSDSSQSRNSEIQYMKKGMQEGLEACTNQVLSGGNFVTHHHELWFYFCHPSENAFWVEFKIQVKLRWQVLLLELFL